MLSGEMLEAFLLKSGWSQQCPQVTFVPEVPAGTIMSRTVWRSVVLAYLQAKKVACQSFMDAGRRYEIPASDSKEFIFLQQ